MKQHGYLIAASIIAVMLAMVLSIRITLQKNEFNRVVQDALETSEGYDERFINMVNKLEEELAQRASFGYKGQKDPMTGKIRSVVFPQPQVRKPRVVEQQPAGQPAVEVETEYDPVKLTAIIFDDEKKRYTAIVMDGERSYSVEKGDRLRDRTITNITNEAIFMESAASLYRYDIYGNTGVKKKY